MADPRPSEPNAKVIVPPEGPREEAFDELRHNGTHTVPPGVRAGWLAKPLPRLTEEHLQVTDELESARLALRSQGTQGRIALLPFERRTTLRLLAGLALVAAVGLFMAFRSTRQSIERSAHPTPEFATAKVLAATPTPVTPASLAPARVAPGPDPSPQESAATASAVEASADKSAQNRTEAAPEPSAVANPRVAASRPTVTPPPRGREPSKKPEARRLDDNDEPLFGPR